MEKENKGQNRTICLLVLLANAIVRLLPIISYIGQDLTLTDPLGIGIFITGIVLLIAGLVLFKTKKETNISLPTGFLVVSILGYDSIESLRRPGFPLSNPFLLLSAISLFGLLLLFSWKGINSAISSTFSKVVTSGSKKKLATVAIVSVMLLPFLSNIRIAHATEIYDHENLTSANGKFHVTVYVYRDQDSMPDEDFYGFDILLHTESLAWFDWIDKVELQCSSVATFDDWQPKGGTTTGGSIGLTPGGPSVSIAIPLSDVRVSGAYTNKINWYLNFIPGNFQDAEFAAKVWVPSGTHLNWKLNVKATSGFGIMGGWQLWWIDTVAFSSFPINVLISTTEGGTTNDEPGLYSFDKDSQIDVHAIPTKSSIISGRNFAIGPPTFWKWVLTGPNGTMVYYANPLIMTLSAGNWSLTAYFKQLVVWIEYEYYHWISGMTVSMVSFEYYDMSWNLINVRMLRCIR
jgi:hypothetical protein